MPKHKQGAGIPPDRETLGTPRIDPDPILDDVPIMRESGKTQELRQGFKATNSEKARSDAQAGEGSGGASPWKPKGRK